MTYEWTRRGRSIVTAALLFVAAFALPSYAVVCGDGMLDLGEDCDEGFLVNGTFGSCCDADCAFVAAATTCRDAAGACDVVDVCDGASAVCPDAKSTAECRPAAGVCDVAESCDGVGDDCPADAKNTAECRAAAGVCDTAETCDGVGDDCPADAFVASTFACRAAAGSCDVAEHCTGSSAACPSDAFAPSGVECRAAASSCDVAESCTGTSAACPADAFQPDETPCDDANVCSINDRCISGTCGGFLENCGNGVLDSLCAEDCDDGNFDAGDGCDATCHFEPCHPEPLAGCRAATTPGKASVQVISRLNPEKNKLQWKYTPGAETPKADFGSPTTSTSYQFCIWEEVGGDPRLSASYHIPAGGMCGSKPCWKEGATGFKYANKDHTPQGIAGLQLKQGLAPGKSKIILSGKGAHLPVPVLPFIQSPDVVMQLISSDGVCWETRYGMPAFRNQPDQFRDK
jgi:cysteine-rich repeat protein